MAVRADFWNTAMPVKVTRSVRQTEARTLAGSSVPRPRSAMRNASTSGAIGFSQTSQPSDLGKRESGRMTGVANIHNCSRNAFRWTRSRYFADAAESQRLTPNAKSEVCASSSGT